MQRNNQIPFIQCPLMVHACMLNRFSRVRLLATIWTVGLQPARLFCPWDFPGKNSGVGYCALLQGIFPTHRSNPTTSNCIGRRVLYHQCHLGSPSPMVKFYKTIVLCHNQDTDIDTVKILDFSITEDLSYCPHPVIPALFLFSLSS